LSVSAHLAAGLGDPVFDSQRVFRAALQALSQPGRPVHLPVALDQPSPLAAASAAFVLTMLDFETPLWTQHSSERMCEYLRFHCGAPLVEEPRGARYALVTDPAVMPDLSAFDSGTDHYPERSATVIVQVPRLIGGRRARLTGPGIAHEAHIEPSGLRPDFWSQWQRNTAAFPCGVDVLFTCGATLLGMPRTTQAEV